MTKDTVADELEMTQPVALGARTRMGARSVTIRRPSTASAVERHCESARWIRWWENHDCWHAIHRTAASRLDVEGEFDWGPLCTKPYGLTEWGGDAPGKCVEVACAEEGCRACRSTWTALGLPSHRTWAPA